MRATDPWEEIALSAAKWYSPPDRQLLDNSNIHVLGKTAASAAPVDFGRRAALAFPAALSPVSLESIDLQKIGRIFFTPLLLRLNYVSQLSTTYLRGNLDAKHCRLSHVLGTQSIVSVLIDAAMAKLEKRPDLRQCMPSEFELVSALTFAALHDAFQGPFGHSIDSLRDSMLPAGYSKARRLDKALFVYLCNSAWFYIAKQVERPPDGVVALVKAVKISVADPFGFPEEEIFRWLVRALDVDSRGAADKQRMSEIGWLIDLLEGPLDADRWDYLWRDTLHLGFSDDHDDIAAMLDVFKDKLDVEWYGDRSRIVVPNFVAVDLGLKFFAVRRTLYKRVYENPGKRVIDSMLVRCVYVELFLSLTFPEAPLFHEGIYAQQITDFAHTTDTDLLSLLERSSGTTKAALVALFARELQTYPAVGIAFRQPISSRQCVELESSIRDGVERVQDTVKLQTQPEQLYRAPLQYIEELLLAIKDSVGKLQAGKREEAFPLAEMMVHCNVMSRRPSALLQFERLTWKLVKRDVFAAKITTRILSIMTSRLERLRLNVHADEVGDALDEFPPLFCSFPWIPNPQSEAMLAIDREPRTDTIVVSESGQAREVPIAELLLGSGEEIYEFVVGFPLFITEGLSEAEVVKFGTVIEAAASKVLRAGCCLVLPESSRVGKYDEIILSYLAKM